MISEHVKRSKGELQCPAWTDNDGGHLLCCLKFGHEGKHETYTGGSEVSWEIHPKRVQDLIDDVLQLPWLYSEVAYGIEKALVTFMNIVAAIEMGWWTIDHDQWQAENGSWHDCPEDDTCECNGGVNGTAGMLTEAINVLKDLQIRMKKNGPKS